MSERDPKYTLAQAIEDARRRIDEWPPSVRIAMGLPRMDNPYYETFFLALSKGALEGLETALRAAAAEQWEDSTRQELEVLANEIRARIQHIDAGDLQEKGSFA